MLNNYSIRDVTEEKLQDLMTPGFVAEVSPEEAEIMGAFVEEALSEDDAKEAACD